MSKIRVFDEHGFEVELIEDEYFDAELDDPYSVTIRGFVISKEQLHEYKTLLFEKNKWISHLKSPITDTQTPKEAQQ